MIWTKTFRRSLAFALPALLAALSMAVVCQAQQAKLGRDQLKEPVYRVSKAIPEAGRAAAKQGEHPLAAALRVAESGFAHIRNDIEDYSCTLYKRERVNGKLGEMEAIFTKVRHERTENGRVIVPFSVYMYFVKPDNVKGRQVIYVAGKNEGKLLAHEANNVLKRFGWVPIRPNSMLAMRGNRYPITEVGIENLTRRLVEVAKHDMGFKECEVNWLPGVKIDSRMCTRIEVVHPMPRKNFRYHKAYIYIDDELNVPIRFESYDWPRVKGGPPILFEEYTYVNLKLNQGFTDADFRSNRRTARRR